MFSLLFKSIPKHILYTYLTIKTPFHISILVVHLNQERYLISFTPHSTLIIYRFTLYKHIRSNIF